jgi:hypothetical protein
MRIELLLMLWIVGFGTLGWSIFDSTRLRPDPSNAVPATTPSVERQFLVAEASPAGDAPPPPLAAAEPTNDGRTLFRIRTAAASPTVSAPPAPPPAIELALRGIVASDGSPEAIFVVDGGDGSYSVARVGESIAGYTIEAICADTVTALTPAGSTRTFALRGKGEGR